VSGSSKIQTLSHMAQVLDLQQRKHSQFIKVAFLHL